MTLQEKHALIYPYLGKLVEILVPNEADRGDRNPCAFDFETWGAPQFYRAPVPLPSIEECYQAYLDNQTALVDETVVATRKEAYDYFLPTSDFIEAFMEYTFENRFEKLNAFQAKRLEIKAQYPKAGE